MEKHLIVLRDGTATYPTVSRRYYQVQTVLQLISDLDGSGTAKVASVNQDLYDYWDDKLRKWSNQ